MHILAIISLLFIVNISLFAHVDSQHKINDLNHKISHHPKNIKYLLQRAEKYQAIGNWTKALIDYKYIKHLNPQYKNITYLLGLTYYRDGQLRLAKIELDKFLKTSPKHTDALIIQARILHDIKQCQASYDNYTKAILTSIDTPALYIERAKSVKDCNSLLLPKAIKDLSVGMDRVGHLIILEDVMIDLRLYNKDYKEALKSIENVLSKVKRKEKWLVKRAKILQLLGSNKRASITYEQAIYEIKRLPAHIQNTLAMKQLLAEIKNDM